MEKNYSAFYPVQNFVRIYYAHCGTSLFSPVFSEVIPSQGYFRAILLLPWGVLGEIEKLNLKKKILI